MSVEAAFAPRPSGIRTTWLFSPGLDALAFGLPAVLSLLVVVWLWARGELSQPVGPLGWFLAVLLVDVAHVYATIYRVYGNPVELRRRLGLYLAVPALAYVGGVFLYAVSALTFWRVLAYLAVFHFIRQQYGWVALASRKAPAVSAAWARRDRILDGLAVYVGTGYPLLYWHTHLPRRFHWFVDGDFVGWLGGEWGLSLLAVGKLVWLAVGALWLVRQGQRLFVERQLAATKLVVMTTTWATWYVGMVSFDSDLAFTITNVLPHGIPYFVLIFRYRQREAQRPPLRTALSVVRATAWFYLPLVALSFVEEGLWDRLVWHERPMLFPGDELTLSAALLMLLVPLLACPQATHYLLDAWIWKPGPNNPALKENLGL